MPSPLDIESQDVKAKVSGTVEVEEGFLPVLLERLGAAGGGATQSLPRGAEVVITGPRGTWSRDVDEAGRFSFAPIYAGAYVAKLRYKGTVLAAVPLMLREKSSLDVTFRLLGYDLADVDGDGDRFEFLLEWKARFGEMDTEFTRTTYADGSSQTDLPDGTTEFFHDGLARVALPDGSVEYRRDRDNDFVPDDVDPDERRLWRERRAEAATPASTGEAKPGRRSEAARREFAAYELLSGRSAKPLMTDVALRVVGDPARQPADAAPGDLVALSATTEGGGGGEVLEVEGRICVQGRPVYAFMLRDDGGDQDLVPKWPGLQSSGDETRNDGSFSYLLPIDRTTLGLLHDCLLVFRGRNRAGVFTNTRVVPLACRASSTDGAASGGVSGLAQSVRDFAMYVRQQGTDGRQLVGRVEVAREAAVDVAAFLVLPGGGRKMLTPVGGGGADVVTLATSPLPWQAGRYLLMMTNRSGAAFYAGFPVRGLPGEGGPKP